MSKTLHLYFLRELIKAFLLTTAGLTLLVTLGGGVANVFRSQGIDALRILKVFALFVPISVTLVLPIAALFSATITYGRAAADNEINACRAAGMNVHGLLASAAAVSVAVSGITYWSWNYFIPGLTERVYRYGQKDIADALLANLRRNRGMAFRDSVLYADRAFALSRSQLPPDAPAHCQYVLLQGAAFLEMAQDQPARCGTTEQALIEFDLSSRPPQVRIDLRGVRSFDVTRGQYMELAGQILGPYAVPLPMDRKLRFENLPTLRAYAAAPHTAPEIAGRLHALRGRLLKVFLHDEVVTGIDASRGGAGVWTIAGSDLRYELRAREFAITDDDGRPLFRQVTLVESGPTGRRIRSAPSGTVRISTGLSGAPSVQIELSEGVEIRREPARRGETPVKLPRERLSELPVPATVRARLEAVPDEQLLDGRHAMDLPPRVARVREEVIAALDHLSDEIDGVIHFRGSYAASHIAVVTLGAILGVVLRGGQVLTAFGISCVPSLLVFIGVIVGRNLAEHPATHIWGLYTMWLVNVVMAVGTVFVATRFLRR